MFQLSNMLGMYSTEKKFVLEKYKKKKKSICQHLNVTYDCWHGRVDDCMRYEHLNSWFVFQYEFNRKWLISGDWSSPPSKYNIRMLTNPCATYDSYVTSKIFQWIPNRICIDWPHNQQHQHVSLNNQTEMNPRYWKTFAILEDQRFPTQWWVRDVFFYFIL